MNFWKTFKTVCLVALVLILGFLYLVSDQAPSTPQSSSMPSTSSDGAAFNGLK